MWNFEKNKFNVFLRISKLFDYSMHMQPLVYNIVHSLLSNTSFLIFGALYITMHYIFKSEKKELTSIRIFYDCDTIFSIFVEMIYIYVFLNIIYE